MKIDAIQVKTLLGEYKLGTVVSNCTLSHLPNCKCHNNNYITVKTDWLF